MILPICILTLPLAYLCAKTSSVNGRCDAPFKGMNALNALYILLAMPCSMFIFIASFG